jgi:trk system potassium uptake protein TrkA
MRKTEKSYVIFGIGKFGRSVAEELTAAGMYVLAVDQDEEKISQVADSVDMAVVADVTDPGEMESLGLSSFDAAIVATTGDLSASVMGVLLAKEAGIPFVMAKASDEMQAKVFERLGADRVVIPEKDSAARLARTLLMGGYKDLVELSDRIRLAEIQLPPEWQNKSLRQLDLRNRHHLNVVAVRHEGTLELNWAPDLPLPEGSTLLVVADRKEFDKLDFHD